MDHRDSLADNLESWAKSLTETAQTIRNSQDHVSPEQRFQLSNTGHSILRATEEPGEQLMDSIVGTVQIAAMRLFVKWKVFENIPMQGDISYGDLAAKVGAETALISKY